jgi:hypothetical protein
VIEELGRKSSNVGGKNSVIKEEEGIQFFLTLDQSFSTQNTPRSVF